MSIVHILDDRITVKSMLAGAVASDAPFHPESGDSWTMNHAYYRVQTHKSIIHAPLEKWGFLLRTDPATGALVMTKFGTLLRSRMPQTRPFAIGDNVYTLTGEDAIVMQPISSDTTHVHVCGSSRSWNWQETHLHLAINPNAVLNERLYVKMHDEWSAQSRESLELFTLLNMGDSKFDQRGNLAPYLLHMCPSDGGMYGVHAARICPGDTAPIRNSGRTLRKIITTRDPRSDTPAKCVYDDSTRYVHRVWEDVRETCEMPGGILVSFGEDMSMLFDTRACAMVGIDIVANCVHEHFLN